VVETIEVIGRRSSLFTRVALYWAEALGVPWRLQPLADLRDLDAAHYAGNPALKLPVLRVAGHTVFGAQHACRVIAGLSTRRARLVWPEDLQGVLACNAHELAWQAMATQVQLVMGTAVNPLPAEHPYFTKVRASLAGSLQWLDMHLDALMQALPAHRDLCLTEVGLFCLLEHLQFRPTISTVPYRHLAAFTLEHAGQDAAARTGYQFDDVSG
jgi:glutathione S-transferase